MEKNSKLNIIIEGFDVPLVEITTAWILRKLLDAKVKFTGKIFLKPKMPAKLPTKWERVTVLRSPHKHKSSQEHLGRITHRRLIQVLNVSFADLNNIGLEKDYPQISRGVQVRVKV